MAALRASHIRIGQTGISEAVERRVPIQIPDVQDDPSITLDIIVRAGFRALLYVPLLGTDRIVGALVGSWLLPQLGVQIGGGFLTKTIVATIGAVVVLFIVGLIRGGYPGRRWRL